MNPVTTALTLNMLLPNIATVSWAVQGDMLSRQIEATLVEGSTAWNPPAGADGIIRYFKPDGTSGVYDVDENSNRAVTWTGNVATLKIAQQALTVAGTVLMQLEFYDSNNERISAFGWAMNVQPSAVTDNEFMSSDYYSLLTLQISAVLGTSGHPPYINSTTKNWMIWDENLNDYADSGFSSVGAQGPEGPQGVSISSVSKASGTGAPGTTDVYNVNLSNSTVAGTFNVYNGADGAGSPGSQTPLMDGTADAGSANAYAREDHVHPSDTSRQATITASGMLKGAGGGSVSAATKGTDFGALSFTVTLASNSWSSLAQTVNNANFITSGYAYIVSPSSSSFEDYGAAQVYADDVTTTGQMTFHCVTAPSSNLTVNIVRVVSA